MSKKETTNSKEVRKQNYEAQKMNTSKNVNKKTDKNLPWWVELLFVQIGLPDKLLIKILKAKKTYKEFIKNDKKSLIKFLFLISLGLLVSSLFISSNNLFGIYRFYFDLETIFLFYKF